MDVFDHDIEVVTCFFSFATDIFEYLLKLFVMLVQTFL